MIGYVIDASVMGPLMIDDEAETLLPELSPILASGQAIVPQHWHLEVANIARMAVRKKRLTEANLVEVFKSLSMLPVAVDDRTTRMAWARTLQLASRHDLTAYDAAYLELAIRDGLILLTGDKALIRAAGREGTRAGTS